MEIKEAGVFDVFKINKIKVDDRSMFDNPIFSKGAAPGYSTWSGIKPLVKFFSSVFHPRKRLFFATEGENVIGVAAISNRSFIDGFFINRGYRGKGFGQKLMDHVCSKICRTSPTIHVGVQSANRKAIDFYEGNGFKINEYIMNKKLER
jgi:GNAT superfamily N-acetyltransferase